MLCLQRRRGQWEQGSKLFHVSFYFRALIVPQAPREAGHPVIRARVLSIKRKNAVWDQQYPTHSETWERAWASQTEEESQQVKSLAKPLMDVLLWEHTKGTPNLRGRRGWREWWPRREAGERASSEIWSDSGSWLGAEVMQRGDGGHSETTLRNLQLLLQEWEVIEGLYMGQPLLAGVKIIHLVAIISECQWTSHPDLYSELWDNHPGLPSAGRCLWELAA